MLYPFHLCDSGVKVGVSDTSANWMNLFWNTSSSWQGSAVNYFLCHIHYQDTVEGTFELLSDKYVIQVLYFSVSQGA
jgi:hypothetical protein